jgi:hypothetical protein
MEEEPKSVNAVSPNISAVFRTSLTSHTKLQTAPPGTERTCSVSEGFSFGWLQDLKNYFQPEGSSLEHEVPLFGFWNVFDIPQGYPASRPRR